MEERLETTGITTETSPSRQAEFTVILAQRKADAHMDIPDSISPDGVNAYILGHLDEAVVTKQYTDEKAFIRMEEIKVSEKNG